MNYDEAYALGVEDGHIVIRNAVNTHIGRKDVTIIVDGSSMSPSWRVLPHGEEVYDSWGDSPDDNLYEGYNEGLDHTIGEYHMEGEYIMWHNGSLYLCGADCEPFDG